MGFGGCGNQLCLTVQTSKRFVREEAFRRWNISDQRGAAVVIGVMEETQTKKEKKKTKVRTIGKVDRISGLPEAVLHHILSFLDMKEVLQTSFISTRWRHLWTTVPVLNFDYSLWKKQKTLVPRPYVKMARRKDECMGFVERVLFLRDNSSTIRKLHLSNEYCRDVLRLNSWLLFAVKQHVKEVSISCPTGRLLENLMLRSEIQVFKLSSTLQLPKSICFAPKLRTLELKWTRFPEGDSDREFVLQCPVLECLILKKCNLEHLESFVISASQLNTLVLEEIRYDGTVRISTPNLKSLQIEPYCKEDTQYSVENLSSLVCAKIGKADFAKFVGGLYNLTTLDLSFNEGSDVIEDYMVNPFPNIRFLNLNGLSTRSIPVVAQILMNSSSLENIAGNNWKEEFSFQHIFHHLKCVKVKKLQGCTNELKFIEFILANTVVLESILVSFVIPGDRKMELKNFIKKLCSLCQASPCLSTCIVETEFQW